jgi:ribosomal protein L35
MFFSLLYSRSLTAGSRSLTAGIKLTTGIYRSTLHLSKTRNISTIKSIKKEYKGKTQSFGKIKVASKRKLKKYKLKTHHGAAARWMVMGDGLFKRGQAGRNHFNRKMSSDKRRSKKVKVISTAMQTRRLKKLLPYFKKRYSK